MTTPAHGPRRRLRTAIAAALAAVGLLALAGCMKVDVDMTLSEEDTASGTMIMAFSNQLAETMGMEPGELWDQASSELEAGLPEGATQEPWSDDEYTGTEITYTDVPLDQLELGGAGTAQDAGLSITREGDEYVVAGQTDMSQDLGQLGDLPEGLQDALDVQISITFPGEVIEANGTVDGNTVSWAPQMGEVTEFQARGSAETGSSFPWWVVGLVVGLIVIGLVVWLVVRNNRRPAPVTGTATGDAALAAGTAPGSVPAPGAGPTPEEQVFGAPPAPPTAPTAEPATGPVADPLEPRPAPESTPPTGPTTGPVAEPFEPEPGSEPGSEPGDPRRPSGPTQGA
ncbi:hypothetical protein M1843_20310 [Isoptericola sp. 4D.3]|uniref:LppM domain-containing protein n=1 Tax=Isoptericola peretonis TaxID=2918523 RepID=A0ABT0J9B5_9MICO|nr:hypothetical protein [Isoptericola sp. 4D.3]